MLTPFDWQEGIGHRAQYVEARLKKGVPVAVASVPEGVLIATFRQQSRKVYEVYDRIAFSGMGVQGDIEAVRMASIDFCHSEGFRRSEEDVSVRRLVSAISDPVKQSFANFRAAPMVVRGLFAELGEKQDDDALYLLDYDGDFERMRGKAWMAGSPEGFEVMKAELAALEPSAAMDDAIAHLREAVLKGLDPDGSQAAEGELPELSFEAALLDRHSAKERKFRFVTGPGEEV
jgi:proteasome alpha subunit